MRVLFLTDSVPNYGGAFLYDGLCAAIGAANVIDFPIKKTYHGQQDTGMWGNMPQTYGPFPWFTTQPIPDQLIGAFTLEEQSEVVERMLLNGDIDVVLLESLRTNAYIAFRRLQSVINAAGVRVVLYDGEDTYGFTSDVMQFIREVPSVSLVLKREYPTDSSRIPNCMHGIAVPFPFSFPQDVLQEKPTLLDIEYDVSMLHGVTHPERACAAMLLFQAGREGTLKNQYICSVPDTHVENKAWCNWHEYMRIMRCSWLSVSVRGAGYDTCRHWEVPACTALARTDLKIVIPNDFVDEVSYVRIRNVDDTVDVVQCALQDKQTLWQIYHNGVAHLCAHHTNQRRAEQLLSMLPSFGVSVLPNE